MKFGRIEEGGLEELWKNYYIIAKVNAIEIINNFFFFFLVLAL